MSDNDSQQDQHMNDDAPIEQNQIANHQNANQQHHRPAARERVAQRQRVNTRLIPHDGSLIQRPIMTRLQEVLIEELLSETVQDRNQDRYYLEAQIMRVIAPNNANNSAFVYGNRSSRGGRNSSQVNYSRLFLLRVHCVDHEMENGRLFYLMEARSTNTSLWERNVEFRDNGVISVGAIIRIIAPQPITSMMNGDIPMVQTPFPVIAMKFPLTYPVVTVNQEIQGNVSMAFVQNGIAIAVRKTEPVTTTCSGLFCDKQRVYDWVDARGCGCYHMIQQRSNLAINHSIRVYISPATTISMANFSSTAFSKLYLSSNIPATTQISALRHTDAFFDLLDCIEEVVNFINEHGGFTVVGWYRRGVINDRTLVANNATNGNFNNNNSEDVQVDNGEINYHVISLRPTNQALLNPVSLIGAALKGLKFDVSTIHQL